MNNPKQKILSFDRIFVLAKQNNIDAVVPKAHSRKKVVATASRCECVYKRTGEPSVPFYEKGGTVTQVTDFFI